MALVPWAHVATLWPAALLPALLHLRRTRHPAWRLPLIGLALAAFGLAAALLAGRSATPDGTNSLRFLLPVLVVAVACGTPAVGSLAAALVRQDLPRLLRRLRRGRGWVLTCCGVGALAATVYLVIGAAVAERWRMDSRVSVFDTDGPLYLQLITGASGLADNPVALKHPLVLLGGRLLVGLSDLLHQPRGAATGFSALAGGAAVALAADYFRRITGSRFCGLLLAIAFAASTAQVVFSAIPETYAFAAAALVGLHWVVAGRRDWRLRTRHEALAAALAMGVASVLAVMALACFAVARRSRPAPATGGSLQRSTLPDRRVRRRAAVRRMARWGATAGALLAGAFAVQLVIFPESARALRLEVLLRDWRDAQPGAAPALAERVENVVRGMAQGVVPPSPVRQDYSRGYARISAGPYRGAARAVAGAWAVLLASVVMTLALRSGNARDTLWAAVLCLVAAGLLHLGYGNANVLLYSGTFVFCIFALVAHAAALWPVRLAAPALGAAAGLLIWRTACFVPEWCALLAAS